MDIEFDPAKRDATLQDRRLDMAKAGRIFAGFHLSREDEREDYGEIRVVTLGRLGPSHSRLRLDGARRPPPNHLAPQG